MAYSFLEKQIFDCDKSFIEQQASSNEVFSKLAKTDLHIFFRGDDRAPDVILQKGFSPWNEIPLEKMKAFIAYFLLSEKNTKIDFFNWWKYPVNRSLNMKQIPFIATGTNDCHLGKFEYKIDLETFNMYPVLTGLFNISVGFNKQTLQDSDILAIQVDKEEVIFATPIPACYIQPK